MDVHPGQVIDCPYPLPADRFEATKDAVTPLDQVVPVLGPPEATTPPQPEVVTSPTASGAIPKQEAKN